MKRLIHRGIVVVTLLVSLPLSGREIVDRIAAVVGTEIITLSEVKTVQEILLKDPTGAARDVPPESRENWAREKAIESLVDQALLRQELKKRQIEVTPDELNQALRGVLRQNEMTLEALQKELSGKGITMSQYKRQLAEQIRQFKFIQEVAGSRVQVTDEEVRRAYESNPKAKTVPFDEAAPGIRQSLENRKFQEEIHLYLNQLRASTFVEVKIPPANPS